jgi:hypothetical protein
MATTTLLLYYTLGTYLYALIIANMTSVLANQDVMRRRFQEEMDKINEFLDNRDIPEGLRLRIKVRLASSPLQSTSPRASPGEACGAAVAESSSRPPPPDCPPPERRLLSPAV